MAATMARSRKSSTTNSPVQSKTGAPEVIVPGSKPEAALRAERPNNDIAPPPPRNAAPAPNSEPDYFSQTHSSIRTGEANPFEVSFAGGNQPTAIQTPGGHIQTPGGTKLPSVAALTSPAGILGQDFNWGSLRSGPLSPAMLTAPQKESSDYFTDGHHLRGGFPTPNESGLRSGLTPGFQTPSESGLRTGLTPGGGGSMFPDPVGIFNQLGSGGATPGALEFHRTALKVNPQLASNRRESLQAQQNITSQPQELKPQDFTNGADVKSPIPGQFDQHDANDAANGLFLLANARQNLPISNYPGPPPMQMPIHAHPQTMQPQSMQMGGQQPSNASPRMGHRNNGSMSTTSGRGESEMSDDMQQDPSRPGSPRGNSTRKRRSPQAASANGIGNGNGGRNNASRAKGGSNKRAKGNNGKAMSAEPKSDVEDEVDLSKDQYNANGKKMTDDEKRKNFLERNRVAALKCRQRKKQWLANLQSKVEAYTAENDALQMQLSSMRDEIVNLKTMLLAHKDCPITQSQGHPGIQQVMNGGYIGQMNPYGMAQNINGQQQQHMNGQQQQAMSGQDPNPRYA